jgi:hypothetical protein
MATPTPSRAPQAPAPRPAAAATPKPSTPQAPKVLPSRLGQVKRGRLGLPPRVLVYGPQGVGKTTIAADADALFLDIEGGSGEVDAQRYPFNPDEPDEFKPRDYDQIVAAIDDLIAHPGHGFTAVALDTGDSLESKIHAHLCDKNKVSSIEKVGGGYGKGYRAAVEELRRLLAKLDVLRAQGVTVIFLAHSTTSTFKNPEGEDFDRFSLACHSLFAGQLYSWCDVVGFLHFEGGSKKLDEDSSKERRARGWSTGRRIMQLAREAAWDAKWRLTVPMELEFEVNNEHPWAPFADAIQRARATSATGPSLHDQIMTELNRIAVEEFSTSDGRPTTRSAIVALLETATASRLAAVLEGLKKVSTPNKEG